jgi:hypothetical protein
MSTKRPSAIGLRKGLGTASPATLPEEDPVEKHGFGRNAKPPVEYAKPVRVTLNFPPDLFRQLDGWTRDAADTIGVPRVGVQDAVRAMVRVIASGQARNAETQVLAELQQARQR